jgi:hypothetical protein
LFVGLLACYGLLISWPVDLVVVGLLVHWLVGWLAGSLVGRL